MIARKPHSSLRSPRQRPDPQQGSAAGGGVAVVKRNANDSLAVVIGSEIVAGRYPVGSRLPAESALLERFKVSRPTLREAFRVLAAKGLIVSRQKVGTSVRMKSEWNMLDPDVLAWHLGAALTEDFVGDLFQLRQLVEPQAAYLAAKSRDPEAIELIKRAYADMQRSKSGRGDLIGADLRFHQGILDATHNLFMGALGGLIHTALLASFRLGWSGATIRDERLRQHEMVLEAIERGEPEVARERMATLLQDSMDDVRRALGGRRSGAPPRPAGDTV